jgi:hypothetical protein
VQKTNEKSRVLARVLAEELKKVHGGIDPVYATKEPSGRKDVTDANSGDSPPV